MNKWVKWMGKRLLNRIAICHSVVPSNTSRARQASSKPPYKSCKASPAKRLQSENQSNGDDCNNQRVFNDLRPGFVSDKGSCFTTKLSY